MKTKLLFISLLVSVWCEGTAFGKEMSELHFRRLEECVRMKNLVGRQYWPELEKFIGPWVYITSEGQYLINYPKTFKGFVPVSTKQWRSEYDLNAQWRDKKQVDLDDEDHSDIPVFTMNFISVNPKDFHYRNPVAYTASLEIIEKTVPLADTEDWSSIFMHEAFHQFQFSRPQTFTRFEQLKKSGGYFESADLAKIFKEESWFKEGIKEENRILLSMLDQDSTKGLFEKIKAFSKKRAERRERYKKVFHKDLAEMEKMWETLEGGARYYEYNSFRIMKTAETNKALAAVDPKYGSYKRYRAGYDFAKMSNLDLDSERTRYFYTTGFVMYLILEKYKPGFSEKFFESEQFHAEEKLLSLVK